MKISVCTTTPFHLGSLAAQLDKLGVLQEYFTYHPVYRVRRLGLSRSRMRSAFWPMMPTSLLALLRKNPRQSKNVIDALGAMDKYAASNLRRCDFFIGLSGMAVQSARVARQKFGAVVVVERGSTHVLTQQRLTRRSDGSSRLHPTYVERELASYDEADYIAIPSSVALNSFIENGVPREKLFVNPYGVDTTRFKPLQRPQTGRPFTVVFVGAWSYRKGVDMLVAAARARPEIRLVHAGTVGDVELPELRNLKSLGHVQNGRLPAILSDADCLVLPSREDGFGLVLLEALACGIPVIASTNTGGPDIKRIMGNSELVRTFESGNVDALVSAIDELEGANLGRSSPLSEALRASLDWSAYARRYVQFLEAL